MAELLNEDEVASRLRRLPWEREGDEIVREWRFDDFAEAIAFVNRVAELSEEANHHPDIFIHGWNKVKLSLTNAPTTVAVSDLLIDISRCEVSAVMPL